MLGLIVLLFVLAATFTVVGIVNPARGREDVGPPAFFRWLFFVLAAVSFYQGCSMMRFL